MKATEGAGVGGRVVGLEVGDSWPKEGLAVGNVVGRVGEGVGATVKPKRALSAR